MHVQIMPGAFNNKMKTEELLDAMERDKVRFLNFSIQELNNTITMIKNRVDELKIELKKAEEGM